MKSPIIPTFSLFAISMSFFVAVVILGGIFRSFYISHLHCVAISFIYAIAAQNIFVFFNIWSQAKYLIPEFNQNINMRLAYTWNRARKSLELI
jgi:5-bromo-4-chloroindolyl phosphate hydrolysis protein